MYHDDTRSELVFNAALDSLCDDLGCDENQLVLKDCIDETRHLIT
jgi:hypothetical protein